MRSIAVNAADFIDLHTADGENCVYVDKTAERGENWVGDAVGHPTPLRGIG